jgi:hypothetical protein
MAQPINNQIGTPLVTRKPPVLSGYVVVGGTWQPKNLLQNDTTTNESEEVFNYSFYAPGDEVSCELVQKVTSPATVDLQPSQVIDEVATTDNPSPGKWIVIQADPKNFGKKALRFSVTLRRHDACDMTLVS